MQTTSSAPRIAATAARVTFAPAAVALLLRNGSFGDDVRNVERGAHERADPVGRLVVDVIGEPQVGCAAMASRRQRSTSRSPSARADAREASLAQRVARSVPGSQARGQRHVVARALATRRRTCARAADRRKAPDAPATSAAHRTRCASLSPGASRSASAARRRQMRSGFLVLGMTRFAWARRSQRTQGQSVDAGVHCERARRPIEAGLTEPTAQRSVADQSRERCTQRRRDRAPARASR